MDWIINDSYSTSSSKNEAAFLFLTKFDYSALFLSRNGYFISHKLKCNCYTGWFPIFLWPQYRKALSGRQWGLKIVSNIWMHSG